MSSVRTSVVADALVQVLPLSESALRLVSTTGDSESDWKLAHLLAKYLRDEVLGVTLTVPTYDAVLVEFDSQQVSVQTLRERVLDASSSVNLSEPLNSNPRHFRVPVVYGGSFGPDLDIVAELTGLSPEAIIECHMDPVYTIRCLGAPGGSPMLNAPDLGRPIPRLASPRARVLQGAVSLAGAQATLTPTTAPGGWHLIGRTPLTVLDLEDPALIPYVPGDTIAFYRISEDEFSSLAGQRMKPEAR